MRRILWLLVVGLALVSLTSSAEADGKNPRLFMPDGQLKSHPVRVYVTQDISASQSGDETERHPSEETEVCLDCIAGSDRQRHHAGAGGHHLPRRQRGTLL